MTERAKRVRVRGVDTVAGQTTKNMPGDPDRLPKQSTHAWLKVNGATGPIEVSPHWTKRRGNPPRPKSSGKPGVQLGIDDVTEETPVTEDQPFTILVDEFAQVVGECGTGKTSPEAIDWTELARVGRKTDSFVDPLADSRYTQVADVSQFGADPRLVGDTPGADEKSISKSGTIGDTPCPTTQER